MDDKNLKQQLEQYVNENGIKYRYIAEQIGISESMLCHYRKGRRNLSQGKLELLKNLLGANV